MPREPLPPVAVVVSFIDRINRGDVEGLGELMSEHHQLIVRTEAPLVGREANIKAWHGYASAFPNYVIYPHRIAEREGRVAVLGRTTGSHLGLPDDEELKIALIWLAEVVAGQVKLWQILEDTPANRTSLSLD